MRLIAFGFLVVLVSGSTALHAQSRTDYAWRPVTEQDGLELAYIYYGAGEHRGGIVVRLRNRNDVPVSYRFVVKIRSIDGEHMEEVQGQIAARSDKTGEMDGLYWAPFDPNEDIAEIGIKGLRVDPVTVQ